MAGILYLVPTPIGNLGDISIRCRQTLEQADFIAAEDTRVTLKLLNHLGIKKSLVSYYEHNKAQKGDVILQRILSGETCALVSDAGSPAISDPGEDLVRQCAQAGVTVCAILLPKKAAGSIWNIWWVSSAPWSSMKPLISCWPPCRAWRRFSARIGPLASAGS